MITNEQLDREVRRLERQYGELRRDIQTLREQVTAVASISHIGELEVERSIFKSTALGCFVYKTSDQSINSGVWTAITWGAALYDTDECWSSGARMYAKHAGYYITGGNLFFESNNVGDRGVIILSSREGVYVASQVRLNRPGQDVATIVVGMLYLDVNEYIEVQGFQTSGGALNVGRSGSNFYSNGWLARIA